IAAGLETEMSSYWLIRRVGREVRRLIKPNSLRRSQRPPARSTRRSIFLSSKSTFRRTENRFHFSSRAGPGRVTRRAINATRRRTAAAIAQKANAADGVAAADSAQTRWLHLQTANESHSSAITISGYAIRQQAGRPN